MRLLTIKHEDFVNYKVPSLFLGTISCGGKCCIENNLPLTVCQNDQWRKAQYIKVDYAELCRQYLDNDITHAIVFGGLEPFEQYKEVKEFIKTLRIDFRCSDDVVIYTGYYESEISEMVNELAQFGNIVIKFGRYIPNKPSRFDEVLGVTLASDNQFAKRFRDLA